MWEIKKIKEPFVDAHSPPSFHIHKNSQRRYDQTENKHFFEKKPKKMKCFCEFKVKNSQNLMFKCCEFTRIKNV